MAHPPDPLGPLQQQAAPAALAVARHILAWTAAHVPPPQEVGPYLGGGVQLEWRHGTRAVLRVMVCPDGTAEYLLHGQSRHASEALRDLLTVLFGPALSR
jgi:hypothetical protein